MKQLFGQTAGGQAQTIGEIDIQADTDAKRWTDQSRTRCTR